MSYQSGQVQTFLNQQKLKNIHFTPFFLQKMKASENDEIFSESEMATLSSPVQNYSEELDKLADKQGRFFRYLKYFEVFRYLPW